MDERALIERARSEPDAFRPLYRHYFPRLYAYVAYRVGRAEDAEDLVAEIFMKVVERLHTFEDRGDGAFAAWVFRIAHNQVASFHRGRQIKAVSLDDLPELRGDLLTPDEEIIRKERFALLRVYIARLSTRRQEVITLRFFGGLRNQEIAAVLDLDERTVASHLSRALQDLSRMYESERKRDL